MATSTNDVNNHDDDDFDDENLFDEESESENESPVVPETKRRRLIVPETREESNTTASSSTVDQSLHSLITRKEWNDVLQRVQQLRAQQHFNEERRIPELHEKEPTLGMTPLYAALTPPERAAPIDVIDALLDSYTIQDTHDFLPNPLLSACAIAHSSEIIKRMLHYQPTLIILQTDEQDMNFLHVVLQHKPTLELVQLLVTTWALESSKNSLEDAWTQLLQTYDGHGVLPIHYAIEHYADTSVILLLLEQCPKTANMCLQTDPDISTVHHAVFHGCTFPVLKTLICLYGPLKLGDAGKPDHKKDTPLHLLFHPDVQHYWLSTNNNNNMSRYQMAWYLMEQYSTALKAFGAKKTSATKTEQAFKLVFTIKGDAGKSVYQLATALAQQHPNCDQLALLMRDFDMTIGARVKDWPHVNYETPEQDYNL